MTLKAVNVQILATALIIPTGSLCLVKAASKSACWSLRLQPCFFTNKPSFLFDEHSCAGVMFLLLLYLVFGQAGPWVALQESAVLSL